MHYHYFTIEQRESLRNLMQARLEGEPRRKALERLHEPDYGTCTRCGQDIAFALLADDPVALLCRGCAAPR
jgi:RNA polymerase-binding transcription factor DksA